MVDEGWTPFGMIFPSLLCDDFETWVMLLYIIIIIIFMHALGHVFSPFFT
jgi:hypothetical protein